MQIRRERGGPWPRRGGSQSKPESSTWKKRYCTSKAVLSPGEVERLEQMGWELVKWRRRNLFFGGVAAVEVAEDGRAGSSRRPPPRRRRSRSRMSVRIRRATPSDAEALTALADEVSSEPEGC